MKTRFYRWIIVGLLLCAGLIQALPVAAAPARQPATVALDTPFELVIGDEVLVGEGADAHYLFFAAVLRDSRCPVGTQCVQAGNALFQLFVSDGERQKTEMVELGTADDQQVIDYQNYTIELLDVDPPAPKPDENFILIEYHLTLVMRAADVSAGTPAPKPTKEAPPEPQQPEPQPDGILAPRTMASCPNFSPFDAAAVLQEPVNADEAITNLLFGPVSSDFLSEEGGLQGFCGYASTLPSAGAAPSDQTRILTQLATDHAVVADRLSAEVIPNSNGTVSTDWFDLFVLAEVVGAANPEHDSDAVFDTLYNFAGYLPLLEILQVDAEAAPSFTVREVSLAQDDPHEAMLWLWQTLDDGYFSLLIARQGLTFDVVAARLGQQVQEKTVLGYSRVILDKLAAPETVAQPATGSAGCDLLTLDQAAAIVGEPVQSYPVRSEQGEGCKYTPEADQATVDRDDFSGHFQTHGLLAGLVPAAAAEQLLSGLIEELSKTGNVTDGQALEDMLGAVQSADWSAVLAQMGRLDWGSHTWQVEALTSISDDTLLVTGDAGNGWPQFFLLRPAADGALYFVTGVLGQDLDSAYDAIVAAAEQLPAATTTAAPTAVTTSEAGCDLATLDEVAALLGEAVQVQTVSNEQGAGCKYIPATEEAWVQPDDFTPSFESQGALIGVMNPDGATWLLSELLALMQDNNATIDEATFTDLRSTVESGAIDAALRQLASLEITADEWQIAALPAVSDDALTISSTVDGYSLTFFFRSQGTDGLVMIAVQLPVTSDQEAMQQAVTDLLQNLGE